MAQHTVEGPVDRAREDEEIAPSGGEREDAGTEAAARHDEERAGEPDREAGHFHAPQRLAERDRREERRPDRRQADQPARVRRRRHRQRDGLQEPVERDADEPHDRERSPGVARRQHRHAPRRQDPGEQQGTQGGAAEDQGRGGDFADDRLRGDERYAPECDREERTQPWRHGAVWSGRRIRSRIAGCGPIHPG